MTAHERTIRPALAGIVVLCFLMPFVEITCGGQKLASLSGIDMAMGKAVKPPDLSGMMGMQQTSDPRYDSPLAKPYIDTTSHDSTTAFAGQENNPFAAGGMSGKGKIEPEPTAAAAFILCALAFLTALGASRKLMISSAVFSGLAAITLFVLKTRFGGEIPPEASAVIVIEWTAAFWIALVGAAILAIFTARLLSEKSKPVEKPRMVIQSYADKAPTDSLSH